MQKFLIFSIILIVPFFLFAQDYSDENVPPGGIAREDLPLAVVWGLSLYGGFSAPFAPDVFAEFWTPGLRITADMDILLRNDAILGLSIGYSNLKFNQQEFWSRRGVDSDAELGDDFDIPITNVLLSFRGFENYMLYPISAAYEIGGGIYQLKNTELDLTDIDPYGSYVVSETDRIDFGAFAGLGIKYLLTDTIQLTLKGRFHHVFKPAQYHQFLDVLVGISIL